MKTASYFAACAVLVACAGCQTAATATAPAAPGTFTQVYAAIFPAQTAAQCNFCHSLPPNQKSNGMLSMGETKAAAYAALVNKPSASSGCKGQPLVVADKPDQSLFYLKLLGSPACGDRMPLGGGVLTATQLELVRSWIAAGALDN